MFEKKYYLKNEGYCNCCDRRVTFAATDHCLRDSYLCQNCRSIPRERALIFCVEKYFPLWKQYKIHESSPSKKGASLKLKNNAKNYQPSHFFPGYPLGKMHPRGFINQDLENQTFEADSFDLVITQDVMEHVFDPAKAFKEIARTLKPGGAHVFTVPIINKEKLTEIRATKDENGSINYHSEPEYHGNPVDRKGSLVTRHWGYDIADFILRCSGLYTTIVFMDNIDLGIRAECIEVLISRKPDRFFF